MTTMTKSLNDEELEKINGAECGMDKNEYKAFLKKHGLPDPFGDVDPYDDDPGIPEFDPNDY